MTNIYFSQFWRLESPRSRCWKTWCVVRACFLVHRWPSSLSLCILMWQKGVRELSGVSLIRVLILFMRAPLLWPSHLLKPPPSDTITLVIKISTHKIWEDTKLQSIASQNASRNLPPETNWVNLVLKHKQKSTFFIGFKQDLESYNILLKMSRIQSKIT